MQIPTGSKRSKVCFVEPMGSYSNVFAQYMSIPMLGPLYLATIAENAGYEVSVLNENILGRQIAPAELKDVDVLCLSCITATVERGKEIARAYKALRKACGLDSRTIIGGIHASMIPEDVQNDFDLVFIGEAETKILDLLDGKIADKFVYGEKIRDLDAVPIPNFRLLKDWQKIKIWPIMTSRGCPYDCTFCSVTEMFGRGYRTRSVERVVEELKTLDKKWYFFVDDHFVLNKRRTANLLKQMTHHKIDINWSCQLRAQVSKDEALVSQMRTAGCRTVFIGFESINPQSLLEMKKGQSVRDIQNAIKIFHKNSINVHGMFMFGSDSDTNDIFQQTARFSKINGLTSVQYLIITPLPGTVFYNKIEREGRLLHKTWRFYDAMHVVFKPKNLTPAELQQGMIDCFSDFYSYSRAMNDAVNAFFETMIALAKSSYKRVHLPSYRASLIKVFGKRIVKNWIEYNKSYLTYLKIISLNQKLNQNGLIS